MKKRLSILFLSILLVFSAFIPRTVFALSDNTLYLGGMPAGFSICSKGASIVGLTDVITESGIKSPSKEAGIVVGDVILSIDDKEVNNADDIAKCLNNGSDKKIIIKRCNEEIDLTIKPVKDLTGKYKLGVFIRDNISGIGTITYIIGNKFASLGHPVINENGNLLEISGGDMYDCNITGYKKGERGRPGELHGVFVKLNKYASIEKNTLQGVYGTITSKEFDYSKLIKIEKGDAEIGKASIYTTIQNNVPLEYSISIVKIDASEKTKNFVIKINDKRLLETTGGIVQGMSGSPIVQNGKLVGAVTHVFINDPTRGFGIDIDNMLKN